MARVIQNKCLLYESEDTKAVDEKLGARLSPLPGGAC